ncbi:MAG: hypothetical protein MZU97_11165 [Bacillus subtilis]|nr:hypothetical protein [Bacillus subtilis]
MKTPLRTNIASQRGAMRFHLTSGLADLRDEVERPADEEDLVFPEPGEFGEGGLEIVVPVLARMRTLEVEPPPPWRRGGSRSCVKWQLVDEAVRAGRMTVLWSLSFIMQKKRLDPYLPGKTAFDGRSSRVSAAPMLWAPSRTILMTEDLEAARPRRSDTDHHKSLRAW